jgi:hypothetical protein
MRLPVYCGTESKPATCDLQLPSYMTKSRYEGRGGL